MRGGKGIKPLVEKTSENIIKIIIKEKLNEGDQLPNEYELAELLEVGRSTVREAIKALVSRNIIEIRRGAGTFVSQKLGVVEDPFGFIFVEDKLQLAKDLLQIRFMLEPQIALLAAQNATKEDIEELGNLCKEIEELILAQEDYAQKDIAYHTKIASCTKNTVMPKLIPIITASINIFISITKKALVKETIETHREIYQAIEQGDGKAAHDAMLLHLVHNRRNIEKL